MREQSPQHARVLIGQCHRRDIRPAPFSNCSYPPAARIALARGEAQRRARSVDQQGAQVAVAALADPE